MFNAGLLPYCKQLDIGFRTLDLIMNEISVDEQREAIQAIVNEGTLKVFSLSGEQVAKVYQRILEYQGVCNLSAEDISVMVYAIDNDYRLLTGDKKLKDKAALENVKVSGVLYITDLLAKESSISNADMVKALERLLDSNNRLPKKLIKERIEDLWRTGD